MIFFQNFTTWASDTLLSGDQDVEKLVKKGKGKENNYKSGDNDFDDLGFQVLLPR